MKSGTKEEKERKTSSKNSTPKTVYPKKIFFLTKLFSYNIQTL